MNYPATPPTPPAQPPQTIEGEIFTPRSAWTTPQFAVRISIPNHTHGKRLIHDPIVLTDDNAVQEYVESQLRQMRTTNEDAIQKIILELISRAQLTTSVFTKLRGLFEVIGMN